MMEGLGPALELDRTPIRDNPPLVSASPFNPHLQPILKLVGPNFRPAPTAQDAIPLKLTHRNLQAAKASTADTSILRGVSRGRIQFSLCHNVPFQHSLLIGSQKPYRVECHCPLDPGGIGSVKC